MGIVHAKDTIKTGTKCEVKRTLVTSAMSKMSKMSKMSQNEQKVSGFDTCDTKSQVLRNNDIGNPAKLSNNDAKEKIQD